MQTSYKVVEIQEREIIISSKASRINVSTDMNAEKLAFKMPRYYNDLDLTSLDLVLYIKGVDVSDILAIRGYEVIDGYIVWEFVPQGAMLLKSGYIDVQVTGVQIVNNTLEVKWQTKIKENAFYINNTLIDIVETVVKPLPTELEQYRAEIVRLIESVNLDDVVMDITADTENVLVLHRGNGTHSNVALNVRGGITLEEVNQVVNTHNASADTHQDIRGKIAENTASINANTTKITENANKIGVLNDDRGYLTPKIIATGSCDDLILNGLYYVKEILNKPSSLWGYLEVSGISGGYVSQVFTGLDFNVKYHRIKSGSKWENWKQIATTDKTEILFPYAEGVAKWDSSINNTVVKVNNFITVGICVKKISGNILDVTLIGQLPVGFRPTFLYNNTEQWFTVTNRQGTSGGSVAIYRDGRLYYYGSPQTEILGSFGFYI